MSNQTNINTNAVRSGTGLSIPTVVGIVFIILKLVGVIHWSWWLVLLPIYGPFALALVLFGLAGLITFFIATKK